MRTRDMSLYQSVIHKTRYARWLHDEGRRETWDESVQRYTDFMFAQAGVVHPQLKDEIQNEILNMGIMPSMRAMMTAGPALDISNVAGFNCAFVAMDHPRAFDEMLYILMCGTGVGFSVERKHVNKLPTVPAVFFKSLSPIVVEDSKIGWAQAIQELISGLYSGTIRELDTHLVRPAGAILKTFGGRASGPEPLIKLANFITHTFVAAAGRQLRSIEVHDINCMTAACVVVGGVRRSALISLTDLDDVELRDAKSGKWWETHEYRALANISAVHEGYQGDVAFDDEWNALIASGSGERGIFNRAAAIRQMVRVGRKPDEDVGTNPCAEILLRSCQFCNLTEVMAREDDGVMRLDRKVELSTILGTFQSTLIDFDYLRPIWHENCKEERLLGVSLTGIYDNATVHDDDILALLRETAWDTNAEWADRLGIERSAMITCVKPSGTVSQLTDTASGIHPRWDEFYIRRIRNDMKDPVTSFLRDKGFPVETDYTNPDAAVFAFPMKAPTGAITTKDVTALEHLNTWLRFRQHWCDHNPSVTIYVGPEEWDGVKAWVKEHFDEVCGISFLPRTEHTYQQAPYESIDEATYITLRDALITDIDWSELKAYEDGGESITSGKELACVAGACEF